jgi:hypothetical protein
MQNPRLHCKIFLHLIPEPEEKASELLRDLIANDIRISMGSISLVCCQPLGATNSHLAGTILIQLRSNPLRLLLRLSRLRLSRL